MAQVIKKYDTGGYLSQSNIIKIGGDYYKKDEFEKNVMKYVRTYTENSSKEDNPHVYSPEFANLVIQESEKLINGITDGIVTVNENGDSLLTKDSNLRTTSDNYSKEFIKHGNGDDNDARLVATRIILQSLPKISKYNLEKYGEVNINNLFDEDKLNHLSGLNNDGKKKYIQNEIKSEINAINSGKYNNYYFGNSLEEYLNDSQSAKDQVITQWRNHLNYLSGSVTDAEFNSNPIDMLLAQTTPITPPITPQIKPTTFQTNSLSQDEAFDFNPLNGGLLKNGEMIVDEDTIKDYFNSNKSDKGRVSLDVSKYFGVPSSVELSYVADTYLDLINIKKDNFVMQHDGDLYGMKVHIRSLPNCDDCYLYEAIYNNEKDWDNAKHLQKYLYNYYHELYNRLHPQSKKLGGVLKFQGGGGLSKRYENYKKIKNYNLNELNSEWKFELKPEWRSTFKVNPELKFEESADYRHFKDFLKKESGQIENLKGEPIDSEEYKISQGGQETYEETEWPDYTQRLLEASSLGINMLGNILQKNALNKNEVIPTPYLNIPYHSPVIGDYLSKAASKFRASVTNRLGRNIAESTSDYGLGVSTQLEANSKANQELLSGDVADSTARLKSYLENAKLLQEQTKLNYNTNVQNLKALMAMKTYKNQLDAQTIAANVKNIDTFLNQHRLDEIERKSKLDTLRLQQESSFLQDDYERKKKDYENSIILSLKDNSDYNSLTDSEKLIQYLENSKNKEEYDTKIQKYQDEYQNAYYKLLESVYGRNLLPQKLNLIKQSDGTWRRQYKKGGTIREKIVLQEIKDRNKERLTTRKENIKSLRDDKKNFYKLYNSLSKSTLMLLEKAME